MNIGNEHLVFSEPRRAVEFHIRALDVFREIGDRRRAEQDRAQVLALEQSARAAAQAAEGRAAFLARASTVLASSLDDETTLTSVARLTLPDLADGCIVDILEEDGRIQRTAVAHLDAAMENAARDLLPRHPLDGEHPLARVLRTGEPLLYPDVPESLLVAIASEPEDLDRVRALGLRSIIVVPLHARGRTLGALWLVSHAPARRYGREDLALAEDLARRAAAAVDNARLYREAERRRQEAEAAQRRLAFLAEAGARLSSSLDYETTLHSLARLAIPFLGDWCAIDVVEPGGGLARVTIAHADPACQEAARELQRRYPPQATWRRGTAAVVRSGKPEFFPNVDAEA
ncbi:MAG: GAF domain-containing protein, partial [Myxococcota bacterium]